MGSSGSDRRALWLAASAYWLSLACAGLAFSGLPPRVALSSWVVSAVLAVATTVLGWRWLARKRSELARSQEYVQRLNQHAWQDAALPLPPTPRSEDGSTTGLDAEVSGLASRVAHELIRLSRDTHDLRALIDALDEPVLATDNRDQVRLCNRAAEKLLASPSRGLVGQPIAQVLTHRSLVEILDAVKDGQGRLTRLRMATPIGARTYHVSAWPIPAASGSGVYGAVLLLRDITEIDEAERVKTEFVANASHELRTPVAAIRAAAETLSVSIDEDPTRSRQLITMIESHVLRLQDMLRDLLDLSRLESPEASVSFTTVSVSGIAATLRELFSDMASQRGVELVFDLDSNLDSLTTDESLLVLIFRNLIENAVKFARESTPVRVTGRLLSVHSERQSRNQRTFPGCPQIARVRFEIEDRGMGIPLQHQPRVFERFYQVEPARAGPSSTRGTGLGLSIAKHAVRALGGQIGLESVWGQGTKVWFEFPCGYGAPTSSESC